MFHLLHYSGFKSPENFSVEQIKEANKTYYYKMFNLILNNPFIDIICNRGHLGEYVYGKYRNYDGEYVFTELETYYSHDLQFLTLIVLIDNPENLLQREDGLSLSKNLKSKTEEIKMFTDAFNKSKIKNKILININGKTINQVHDEIINFIKDKYND